MSVELRVVTWNMQARSASSQRLDRLLDRWNPDLLLLQEASADGVGAEPGVPARLGHRFALRGAGTVAGMAIFSSFALSDTGVLDGPPGTWDMPRVLWARLAEGPAQGLVVVDVHLRNPLGPVLPILPLERGARDRQRRALQEWASARLDHGDRLLVGGDFNTIDCRLERLTNLAEALGRPLRTWRPYGIPFAPPVLRIDHLFVGGPRLEPRSLTTECRPTGTDHCALIGTIAIG